MQYSERVVIQHRLKIVRTQMMDIRTMLQEIGYGLQENDFNQAQALALVEVSTDLAQTITKLTRVFNS